jgi:predicted enzyme related to lactoylglutathione lyase
MPGKRKTRPAVKSGKSTKPVKARTPAKRARRKPPRHVPAQGVAGWITHTDFSSRDPLAMKAWCERVFGWTFPPAVRMPDGTEYHLFSYSDRGGGGIALTGPNEAPGAHPYVHVADAQAAFDAALRAGAEPMMPPDRVMEGVTIAIVRAPGGVVIGLSGP